MRYGYGIPTPSGQSGGGSGSTSIPLRLKPVVAFASEYGWLNAIGEPAGYLESVSTLRNAGTGADGIQLTESSRPTCLAHDGENYLHLPGVAGNHASVPDDASLAITGDINIEVGISSISGNGDGYALVSKDDLGSNRSFFLVHYPGQGNRPSFEWFPGSYHVVQATAAIPVEAKFIRVSLDVDNGVGGHDVRFYTSLDGVAWTQLGSTLTGAGVTYMPVSAVPVAVGARPGSGDYPFRGAINSLKIFASTGHDDPRLDVQFSAFAHGATSGLAATGQTVTINQSGGNMATIVGHPMLRFDGVDDRFTIPGVSITGPKTFVAVMRLTSKANQLAWSVGNADAYAWGIESGLTSANTDSPPTGVAAYRKNGAPAAISTRDDLYDALQSQRVLLVSTYTFSSVAGDLDFGGVSTFGGLQLQGDIEKILAYPRILPNNEIEMLEAYLLG